LTFDLLYPKSVPQQTASGPRRTPGIRLFFWLTTCKNIHTVTYT